MLTYRIGKKDIKSSIKEIPLFDGEGNAYPICEKEGEIIINSPSHKLRAGDMLYFERNDGVDIQFYDSHPVYRVIDEDTFSIRTPELWKIDFNSTAMFEKRYSPEDDVTTVSIISFFVNGGTNHIFRKNKGDYKIKAFLYGDDEYDTCEGYAFIYEDDFLFRIDDGELNWLNETGRTIFVYLNEAAREEADSMGDSAGVDWTYEEGVLTLKNCMVPVDAKGKDIPSRLYWVNKSDEVCEILSKNTSDLTFYSFDERFIENTFEESEEGFICGVKPGVKLIADTSSIDLYNIVSNDFSLGLRQDDIIKQEIVDKAKNVAKNAIIDYEKQCFVPVYDNGGNICELSSIIFRLHFRKRELDENFSYGEWKTNDNLFWNEIDYTGGSLVPKYDDNPSDLLGYLGFSDDDVFYKKKKLENTFIRLSFYDTMDRRTQNLLYTSTIFVNSSKLYSDYVENVKFGVEKKSEREIGDNEEEIQVYPDEYVFVENARKRLCAEFSCGSRYSSEISSEGFYLYLFPGVLNGESAATIYMKVEFNHAKYGYTLPMLHTESNSVSGLKANYMKSGNGGTYVDMTSLFNDLYIPITIKYDEERRRYTWEYEGSNAYDDDILVLNLFEPKINKGETA